MNSNRILHLFSPAALPVLALAMVLYAAQTQVVVADSAIDSTATDIQSQIDSNNAALAAAQANLAGNQAAVTAAQSQLAADQAAYQANPLSVSSDQLNNDQIAVNEANRSANNTQSAINGYANAAANNTAVLNSTNAMQSGLDSATAKGNAAAGAYAGARDGLLTTVAAAGGDPTTYIMPTDPSKPAPLPDPNASMGSGSASDTAAGAATAKVMSEHHILKYNEDKIGVIVGHIQLMDTVAAPHSGTGDITQRNSLLGQIISVISAEPSLLASIASNAPALVSVYKIQSVTALDANGNPQTVQQPVLVSESPLQACMDAINGTAVNSDGSAYRVTQLDNMIDSLINYAGLSSSGAAGIPIRDINSTNATGTTTYDWGSLSDSLYPPATP